MSKEVEVSSSPSLRIAVVGVGGVGSTFAFQLARTGHEVTAVARPESVRLQQLRRDGAIVNTKGERGNVRVAEVLDEEIPYDLVLVANASRANPPILGGQDSSDETLDRF